MDERLFMRTTPGTSSYFWAAFPFLSTIFCILLTMVPLGLSSAYLAPPSFALVSIYIWVLVRPSLMSPPAVFVLGLLQDLVWGGPLGLWAAVFLIAYVLTASQRQFLSGRGFGIAWAAFGIVVLVCEVLAWIIASVFYWSPMPILPILSQMLLTFALYPVFARIAPFFVRRIGDTSF